MLGISANPREMNPTVFAILVEAHAELGNEYPCGEIHTLIVLVPANSTDDAMTEAMIALTDKHWSRGEVRQVGEFSVAPESIPNPVLSSAAQRAFEGHRAIVVYDKE